MLLYMTHFTLRQINGLITDHKNNTTTWCWIIITLLVNLVSQNSVYRTYKNRRNCLNWWFLILPPCRVYFHTCSLRTKLYIYVGQHRSVNNIKAVSLLNEFDALIFASSTDIEGLHIFLIIVCGNQTLVSNDSVEFCNTIE